MNRREALALTAALLGGTVIGGASWLSSCAVPGKLDSPLRKKDMLFLDEVAETILPKTERSPGAKEARVGAFMKIMVTDCYSKAEQKIFMDGMENMQKRAVQQFARPFMKLSAAEKFQLLAAIDVEATAYDKTEPAQPHYFSMMKQLTIWGYFSSEQGCTQALRYNPVPGRYEGCVPYEAGTAAWY